jgi:transposase InsO family protein
MDTLMIDYIEKLPEDSEGCKFILVIVDCFSRFCTLHATKTTQASELAMKLLIHASFFGMPCRLTSDRGSSLTSNLIEDFTALVGTEHIKALAASKEELAIVERLNREIMRHLRNIVFDRQHYDNWSRMLPFTNRILNSTIHSSTGMSPAEIIFGSSIRLNRGILAPLLEGEINTVLKNCT